MAPDELAPESLPKYLAEGLPKQDTATLEDAREYINELIEYQQRPVDADDLPDEVAPVEDDDETKGTIVKEKVRCGKDSCHCADQDGELHGPYKYRYFRDESGNVKSEYVGKP